jgi:hypothetical protein
MLKWLISLFAKRGFARKLRFLFAPLQRVNEVFLQRKEEEKNNVFF